MTERRRWGMHAAIVAALALAASAVGVRNDYTYDDRYIIAFNPIVHTLHGWWRLFELTYWPPASGGDGYRPLTMIAFAAEWVLAHGAPWLFHAVNIGLYAATSVAVFWLASAVLPMGAAWAAAALFAVHPLHVEAVANTVGQEELWVALLLVWSVGFYVRRRLANRLTPSAMCGIALAYAAACGFKEHAIVLPALLILAEAVLIPSPRPLRARLRALRPFGLGLLLVAVAYLGARSVVQKDSLAGFQPYVAFQILKLGYRDRVLTMIGAAPQWVRLFLWPARLTTEYAPPYVDIAQGVSITQLPGALLLIGVMGLAAMLCLRKHVAGFAIGWVVITLLPVSNFILPAGFIIAERTLFLPSVGAMLVLGSAVPWLEEQLAPRRLMRVAGVAGVLLLALGVWRSVDRTRVWRDNDTLFHQAVIDAPLSYRAHYMLGVWLFERKRKREGEQEYLRALKLFPYDPFMAVNLAEQYRMQGIWSAALPMYRWAYELVPNFLEGRQGYAVCLLMDSLPQQAKDEALDAMRTGAGNVAFLRNVVAAADSVLADDGSRPRRRKPKVEPPRHGD